MTKYVLVLFLFFLSACTYSIVLSSSEGGSSGSVDEKQDNALQGTLSVPANW